MSNEKFKVKFGLAVGDTAATIDGTTGDIYTDGDVTIDQNLQVNGSTILGNDYITDTVAINGLVTGDITFSNNSSTTQRGIYGTAGTNDYWRFGGGASSGSDTGFAAIVTGDNGTEPIYAQQYSGASVVNQVTLLDASGNTVLTGDLAVNGGDITTTQTTGSIFNSTATTVNLGGAATTVSIGANTGTTTINNSLVADDISITTVDTTNLEVTNIKAKDGTAAMTIADSTGAVNVSTQLTVDNINISGNSIISTDTNGNITLAPNGTGSVVNTFSNGGNLTSNRNMVVGAIRNSTTAALGDIWALNATTPVGPLRGLSVDNSGDTTRAEGIVARTYSNTANVRSRLVFERSRFTGTIATPSQVLAGDFLGEIGVGGYSSTGWVNDTLPLVPAFFGFNALENWTSNTNLGTTFTLSLLPTATTATSSAQNIPVITANPQGFGIRADGFGIGQGKTSAFVATGCSTSGSTLTIGTVTSGTPAVGQLVQNSLNSFNAGTYIISNVSGSGSGSVWTVSSVPGTQSSLTVTGQTGYLGAPTTAGTVDALQNFRLLKNTIQGSSGTTQITTSASGTTLALAGDTINLQTAASASIVGNNISYNRVYGQWQYNTLISPAAANTAYVFPLGTPDFNNIATVGSTSRLIPGAAGKYNFQFSIQVANADNGSEHTAYIWLRKNGTDVTNSMGRVSIVKSGSIISSWNYILDPANTTDYFELAYAVDSTQVTFPTYAATAFGPSTATLITTLTPVGA